jgi:hypothetical protein
MSHKTDVLLTLALAFACYAIAWACAPLSATSLSQSTSLNVSRMLCAHSLNSCASSAVRDLPRLFHGHDAVLNCRLHHLGQVGLRFAEFAEILDDERRYPHQLPQDESEALAQISRQSDKQLPKRVSKETACYRSCTYLQVRSLRSKHTVLILILILILTIFGGINQSCFFRLL